MDIYDAVVVGARAAGAATALLLARQGRRVLLLDRGRYGADTLSTHALMRGGVYLLSRWGLLDRIDAPPVRRTRFDYGTESVTVDIKPTYGVEALYAPRRTVLDPLLVDAAVEAGAEVRFGVTVTGLLRDGSGRVTGVHGHDRLGSPVTVEAGLTVGADGIRSTVAREAGAATLRTGTSAGSIIYGYWSELPVVGYEWFYRRGCSAGLIPTNGAQVCVFAGAPASRLATGPPDAAPGSRLATRPPDAAPAPDCEADHRPFAGAPTAVKGETYHRLLEAATGGAGGRLATARPPDRLRTWVGRPGFIRQPEGPGWALVGDAGSFVDPLSTHGITDALRDAELLATGRLGERDRAVEPIFDAVERIAAYDWDVDEIGAHLRDLNAAMNAELKLITSDTPHA